jgi:hypothetical protein
MVARYLHQPSKHTMLNITGAGVEAYRRSFSGGFGGVSQEALEEFLRWLSQ